MHAVLLIDFGSTNTKVTAVDAQSERILGTATAYTTVETDVGEGLDAALEILYRQTGRIEFAEQYACSSAAGGLRMITSGLVPELTAEAARLASLGAGAKVIATYSYQFTEDDIDEIDAKKPDILLLTGGTDGGNQENILHNAEMLASCKTDFPIVIAGNRNAARACERLLAGRETIITKNVMPRLGTLDIEPAKEAIRSVFLRRIVQAKGLSKATKLISGILMPTPAAMLKAMQLLSDGTKTEKGIGDLMAVDLGGATTDVYSIADGMPSRANTITKGLPEPHAKRTVEGDIGMRYSVHGIVEAEGVEEVARMSGLTPERCAELVMYLSEHTDTIPDTDELYALDYALAAIAIRTACIRHAGLVEESFTPCGMVYVQSGKDLTLVENLIVTGGAAIHAARVRDIAQEALYAESRPASLRPKRANLFVDKRYILAAMGLFSERYPDAALRMMKKELESDGRA